MKHAGVIVLLVALLSVTIFTYHGLTKTYFRQDEWYSLGQVLATGPFNFLKELSLGDILGGKIRPLGSLINNLFDTFFPFNIIPFVIYGIVIHTVNAILVYLITKRLLKSSLLAVIAAVLFTTSYVFNQTLTWFAAPVNTLGAAFFLLVSILLFLVYLEMEQKTHLLGSLLAFYVATLFKESALVGLVILPLLFFLFRKKSTHHKARIIFIPILGYVGFLLFTRIMPLFGHRIAIGFVSFSRNAPLQVILHALLYPLTSFSQMFIPQQIMFRIASLYQANSYPFLLQMKLQSGIHENVTSDLLSLLFTLLIFIICFVLFTKAKNLRKPIIFSVIFSLVGFLPYIILFRGTSYLDSRYYYISMIGGAILLSIFVGAILKASNNYQLVFKLPIVLLVVFGLTIYIYKNVVFTRRDILSYQFDSAVELKLLNQIKKLYPDPTDKPVFYVTGSRSYYGVNNLHVPLQAGPGYILMIWYFPSGRMSPQLLHEAYFYDFREYGYRRAADSKAFGYYSDFQMLTHDFHQGVFQTNQLHALYYDADAYTAKDITNETIHRLTETSQ